METNEPYPIEITQIINAFLDRIEQVLLDRGTTRTERTSICAEVETQIHTMIERKIEAGAELNLELISGIIESMDPPESYAQSLGGESVVHSETLASSNQSPKMLPMFGFVGSLMERFHRTTPGVDWVAFGGLAATCIGLLLMLVGAGGGRAGEGVVAFGFLSIFAGVAACGISFWRIRHSNGLLTGQRVASVGMLMLPILLINAILCVILFASPFGRFLGAMAMATALVYANYRFVQYALSWLASYTAAAPLAQPVKPEPKTDSGVLTGATP